MPKYDFLCNKCGKTIELYTTYQEAIKGLPCDCGGTLTKQFSKANIIGCNPYIYRPGLDPEVERIRARKSLEEKVERGEYIRVGDTYRRIKKGGRIK